jgi:NitT/TauT family transport system permease protein
MTGTHSASLSLRFRKSATSPAFWRGVLGISLFFVTWYLATAVLKLPRFENVPDPLTVVLKWLDPHATRSLFASSYYVDILYSVGRTYVAFLVAVVLGVGVGLLMGWSTTIFNFTFPLVEIFRPPSSSCPAPSCRLSTSRLSLPFSQPS